MKKINCALCLKSNYEVLYKENFDLALVNEKTFSARRIPDGCHYRIVRCQKCGLIYSNPILEEGKIKQLYCQSRLTYSLETDNLRKTYGRLLKKVKGASFEGESLLEIGCGNGFFLEEALGQGFKEVWGVEPSVDAAKKASRGIRKRIKIDVFRPGLFPKSYFDIICFFQTLDHIINPNLFLKTCFEILKNNGVVLCVTHNSKSFLNKVLGEKSPIFDIEHIYLFDKKTLIKLFEKNKFSVLDVFDIANDYSLNYWIKIFPLGRRIRNLLEKIISFLSLDRKIIKLKAGNIGLIAQKNEN